MSEVSVQQTIHNETTHPTNNPKNQEGTLKTAKGEHTFEFIPNTESISQGASEFLQQAASLQAEEYPVLVEAHELTFFSPETIHVESEILQIMAKLQESEKTPEQKGSESKTGDTNKSSTKNIFFPLQNKEAGSKTSSPFTSKSAVVHTSLFSLARSFNQAQSTSSKMGKPDKSFDRPEIKSPLLKNASASFISRESETFIENSQTEQKKDREKDEEKRERQDGGDSSQDEQKKKQNQKEALKRKITGVSASTETSSQPEVKANPAVSNTSVKDTGGIDNIFIRFMALMARILGQAEAEAHELYLRIKDRTDSIDVLTHFISKINSSKGDIDLTKDEEMKKLVEKVKALGVDIPADKTKWTDDEKKLLKENVQMRKDSMEKVTQLERTDMQRYLQEASQCHQARSNVLKLLKEVMDTIIHNMRP